MYAKWPCLAQLAQKHIPSDQSQLELLHTVEGNIGVIYKNIYHDHNHDGTLTLNVDHSYSAKTENIFKDYYYYVVCFPEGRIYRMQGCKL